MKVKAKNRNRRHALRKKERKKERGSSVAERSKALYTGSRGRGFESRSFCFFLSELNAINSLTSQSNCGRGQEAIQRRKGIKRWKRNNKGGGGKSKKKGRQANQEWLREKGKWFGLAT